MQLLRLKSREGVVVRDVEKDSPGDKAGIKVDRKILAHLAVNEPDSFKKLVKEASKNTDA